MKPQTFNSNYFRVKMFFGDDGFQNMFFYQPTFNMLDMLAHVAKVSNRNALNIQISNQTNHAA